MGNWLLCTVNNASKMIQKHQYPPFAESTLRRFCEFVQIDYQDTMINWPPPPEDQAHLFNMYAGAFKKAGVTEGIGPLPKDTEKSKYPEPNEEVQIVIDRTMPVYKFLKEATADKTFKM